MQTDQNRRQQAEFDRSQRELNQRNLEAARQNANRGGGGGGGGDSGCFSADTRVKTASGWVPISEISKGDKILAYHGATQSMREQAVFKVRKLSGKRCVRLHLSSGEFIDVTKHHPLLTSKGWSTPDRLAQGTILPNFDNGGLSGNEVVRVEPKTELEDVYHLYCGFDHTYIVEHAVSHCFSFARSIRGFRLDAACVITQPVSTAKSIFA